MKVWAIYEECSDYFYGYFISELFIHKETAIKRLQELKELNKGTKYADEVDEVEINEE